MPRDRSLAPREYGAYAELAFPLATGFALGGLTVAGAGFAGAAVAGFLLVEPLAILAGARGQRAVALVTPRARRRIALLVGLGALAAGVAVVEGPGTARIAALVPAGLAATLVPALARGRHKTLGGELLVAAALSAMVLPVGLAGPLRVWDAVVGWLVWLATFWLATLTVHAIKTRFKPASGSPWTLWGAPGLAGLVVSGALLAHGAGHVSLPAGLAVVPAAVVAGAALAAGVTPRHLRRVGWSLVAANLATFGLLLLR